MYVLISLCMYFIIFCRAVEPKPLVFDHLEPEPLEKNTRSRSLLEKKSQEPLKKYLPHYTKYIVNRKKSSLV